MYKLLKYLSACILFILVFTLISCNIQVQIADTAQTTTAPIKTDEDMIVDRLEAFETAYNTGDMEAFVNCLDAKTRNGLKGLLDIGSSYIDLDINSLFGIAMATQDIELSIDILSVSVQSSTTAYADIVFKYSEKLMHSNEIKEETANMRFNMIKENGDWYINDSN